MFRTQIKFRSQGRRELLLSILCALLITFAGAMQAVHVHDLSSAPHPECSLCVTAHAGISLSAPVALPVAVEQTEEVDIIPADQPRETFVFSFYCRPPPAEPAFV